MANHAEKWQDKLVAHMKGFILGEMPANLHPKILIIELGLRSSPLKWLDKTIASGNMVRIGTIGKEIVMLANIPPGTFFLESLLQICKNDDIEHVLCLGSIGSTQEYIETGDIIVPQMAFKGDGISQYYSTFQELAKPDSDLLDCLIQALNHHKMVNHLGKIYTTSSIFIETDDFISYLKDDKYLGIECETAALFSICKKLRYKVLVALVAADNLVTKYIGRGINFPDERFGKGLRSLERIYRQVILEDISKFEMI